MKTRKEKAIELFKQGYGCSQAVLGAYCDAFGMDMETALKIASPFGAGMARMREVCGAVSGMFMVAGLYNGAADGSAQAKKDNYELTVRLANEFIKRNGSIVCSDLLGIEKPKGRIDTTPQPRTNEYYKKRPCVAYVEDCADIIDSIIMPQVDKKYQNVRLVKIGTEADVARVSDLAYLVLSEEFKDSLSYSQIQEMVDKYQSTDAIMGRIINGGSSYYLIVSNEEVIGYVGTSPLMSSLRFGMYIKNKYRNQGYGRATLDRVVEIARRMELESVVVTCAAQLENTAAVLKEWGFDECNDFETVISDDLTLTEVLYRYTL